MISPKQTTSKIKINQAKIQLSKAMFCQNRSKWQKYGLHVYSICRESFVSDVFNNSKENLLPLATDVGFFRITRRWAQLLVQKRVKNASFWAAASPAGIYSHHVRFSPLLIQSKQKLIKKSWSMTQASVQHRAGPADALEKYNEPSARNTTTGDIQLLKMQ